jgi:hypothetical protein
MRSAAAAAQRVDDVAEFRLPCRVAEQQPETVGISGGHPHQHWDAAVVEDVLADGRGEPLTCRSSTTR